MIAILVFGRSSVVGDAFLSSKRVLRTDGEEFLKFSWKRRYDE